MKTGECSIRSFVGNLLRFFICTVLSSTSLVAQAPPKWGKLDQPKPNMGEGVSFIGSWLSPDSQSTCIIMSVEAAKNVEEFVNSMAGFNVGLFRSGIEPSSVSFSKKSPSHYCIKGVRKENGHVIYYDSFVIFSADKFYFVKATSRGGYRTFNFEKWGFELKDHPLIELFEAEYAKFKKKFDKDMPLIIETIRKSAAK